MLHFFRHRKERRVPVDLVVRRLEQRTAITWRRRMHIGGTDYPDRNTFVTPRVNVARVLDRHLGIRRMEAADVLVCEPVLRADEDFPQRPFQHRSLLYAALRACFSACASAASRTHVPSSQAFTRVRMRSRLHGPFPL